MDINVWWFNTVEFFLLDVTFGWVLWLIRQPSSTLSLRDLGSFHLATVLFFFSKTSSHWYLAGRRGESGRATLLFLKATHKWYILLHLTLAISKCKGDWEMWGSHVPKRRRAFEETDWKSLRQVYPLKILRPCQILLLRSYGSTPTSILTNYGSYQCVLCLLACLL